MRYLLLFLVCSCEAPFEARQLAPADAGEGNEGGENSSYGSSGARSVSAGFGGEHSQMQQVGGFSSASVGGLAYAGRGGEGYLAGVSGASGMGQGGRDSGKSGGAGAGDASGSAGVPDEPTCPELECSGACVARLDDRNCGACGNECPQGASCKNLAVSGGAACACAGCVNGVGACAPGVPSGGCAIAACEAPCPK